jgi:hypothetical protein
LRVRRVETDAGVALVHIVAHQDVLAVKTLAPDLKEPGQVMEKSMNVPTDRHRGIDSAYVLFVTE